MNDYLIHYGVLGMKWGVRRYQNEDGTLTAAGKKRYDTDVQGAKQRVDDAKAQAKAAAEYYNKVLYNGSMPYSKKEQKAYSKWKQACAKVKYEKDQYANEKIKEKLNLDKAKSKRRVSLEEKYKREGLSQEDAEIAAYKREKNRENNCHYSRGCYHCSGSICGV